MADNAISPGGMLKFQDSDYINRMALRCVDAGGGVVRVEMIYLDANGSPAGVLASWDTAGEVSLFGEATVAQQTAITHLTDSSAGTANNTIEALPNPTDSPATADALRDDLVAVHWPAIRNNFADLTAKVNAILTALENVGILA